jgi:hypothetical protein
MSTILEKKHMIHILTEIVVLVALTFYFSSKNKKLLEHIEDLSKRLEEQEELVQNHEKIIQQLLENVNKNKEVYKKQSPSNPKYTKQSNRKNKDKVLENKKNIQDMFYTQDEDLKPKLKNRNSSNEEKIKLISDSDTSDLDNEIAQELDELNVNSGKDTEDDLKKRT